VASNNEIRVRPLRVKDGISDYNLSVFKLFYVHPDDQQKMYSNFYPSRLSFPYLIFPYTTLQSVL
jgi:hypothetical protein